MALGFDSCAFYFKRSCMPSPGSSPSSAAEAKESPAAPECPPSAADTLPVYSFRTLAEYELAFEAEEPTVDESWTAVALEVNRTPFAGLSGPLHTLQRHRGILFSAVSAVGLCADSDALFEKIGAMRDRAAAAVVDSLASVLGQTPSEIIPLREWIQNVEGMQPSEFRMPAAVDPLAWRDILSDYLLFQRSQFRRLAFDHRLHAAGASSLLAFLYSLPTADEIQEMRDQLTSLRMLMSQKDGLPARLNSATNELEHARIDLQECALQLERCKLLKEPESRISDLERLVSDARARLHAAMRGVRGVYELELQLSGSIYPEYIARLGGACARVSDYSDLKLVSTLRTSNHPVRLANGPNGPVVLKEFSVNNADCVRFRNEVALLHRLAECDGVVKVVSYFIDGDRAFIEMPHYAFSSVLDWIRGVNPTLADRLRCAHRIAAALERVHAADVVHCDIKPDNLFVDADGLPYIGDFDVSMSTDDRARLFSTQTLAHGGTAAYMAPEVLRGLPATKASDVHSLGMVFIDMFGDGTPRDAGAAPVVPCALDPQLRRLLEAMVHADPTIRPTAAAVAASPAFSAYAHLPMLLPLYWTNSRRTVPVLVDVTEKMQGILQKLVDRTVLPGALGRGRDVPAGSPPYSRLVVAKVDCIESPALFQCYSSVCNKLSSLPPRSSP